MKLEEYQKLAARTCADLGNNYLNMLHMKVGILTEIGELADIFKKNLAYDKPVDRVHIGEEIADVCWYEVNRLRFLGQIPTEKNCGLYMTAMDTYEIIGCLIHYTRYNIIDLMVNIAISMNLEFSELLDRNINKLKVRFPDKFDTEKALNRDLESERKELEK